MQYYLLILLAVILLALQFSTNKLYQLRCGNTAAASLTFSTLSGLTTSVIFFVLTFAMGETFTITPYSLLMAAIIAVLCCTYTFIGFKIMSFGSMSVFMMFLMLGGMLLPYLFGVFYLDEGISVGRVIGVILLVVSMVFPVLSKDRSSLHAERMRQHYLQTAPDQHRVRRLRHHDVRIPDELHELPDFRRRTSDHAPLRRKERK